MKKTLLKIFTLILSLSILFATLFGCEKGENMNAGEKFTFPSEEAPHEGTWLVWPHQYTYGKAYRDEVEPVWVAMTNALTGGENVHIVAYDVYERDRIVGILSQMSINLARVDFVIAKTDDVWVRDMGAIFLVGEDGRMVAADFGFDGWGKKAKYKKDNALPKSIAKDRGFLRIDIGEFVLEGGAIELDGNGTLMASLSSVKSNSRNKRMKLEVVESYLKKYFSVKKFIWLEGVEGEDITDAHIDGTARFAPQNTILTVSEKDFYLLYEGHLKSDYEKIVKATNAEEEKYKIVELPLTKEDVAGLDYKGTYMNYYVANGVVLVPTYNDPNDAVALSIISDIYKDRKIVPVNVVNLFKYGGMIHCITQQQPKLK